MVAELPIKQVIVVRKDLNMRKGKMAAQVAHASMKSVLDRMSLTGDDYWQTRSLVTNNTEPMELWLSGLFAKVVVFCDDELALHDLICRAEEEGVACSIIIDAGRTEFDGVPTLTCAAFGPDEIKKVNNITGLLKLA